MKSLQTGVLLLGILLAQSEALERRCFARFNLVSGQCEEELATVDEDDCCQNPLYGFIDADGVCRFCGPSMWTAWSSWSQCTEPCGWGVLQRTRKCHGPECLGDQTTVENKPCESNECCPAAVWEDWGAWTSCSVSCGNVQGHRRRERVCSHLKSGCRLTCVGQAHQTEPCVETQRCPVHGGWAKWANWGPCSAVCIPGPFREGGSGRYPTRTRHRTCSSPAPSQDTRPVGNNCVELALEEQSCKYLPNCPVDGGWGTWGPFGACSTSCGEGLQQSTRLCDNPGPQYGGLYCQGTSTQSTVCRNTCPVHGTWTGWSVWGECSASCHSTSHDSVRTRQRFCSNPAPSSQPEGNACPGNNNEAKKCDEIPNCPAWGPWAPYSSCSATCGVGVRRSLRTYIHPPPKHDGNPGSTSRTLACVTNTHCPIDGVWSEWGDWGPCHSDQKCENDAGYQNRIRSCLHRDFGGVPCPRGKTSEQRACYDIDKCSLTALGWTEWSEWSVCDTQNRSMREKTCEPDLSKFSSFSSFGGRISVAVAFHGTPEPYCGPLPKRWDLKNCNIPPTA